MKTLFRYHKWLVMTVMFTTLGFLNGPVQANSEVHGELPGYD